MTPQLHAFINTLYLFAGAALFLAVAACIAALMLRHEQRARAFDAELNSHRLPGEGDVLSAGAVEPDDASPIYDTLDDALAANGLSHWTSVSADEMQPFEESLRQVRVIDFEEGA